MTIATELPPEAVEPEVVVADAARPSLLYSWIVVGFLMVLYTSSFIDRQILALLVKPIRSDLKIDDFQYGLLTGLAFVGIYSIAGLPIGVIVDRWSRKGVILIGVTAWSLMTAACGLTNSFGSLFATRPSLFTYIATPEELKESANALFAVVQSNKVRININQTYPLRDVGRAHTDLEARKTTGTTLLIP